MRPTHLKGCSKSRLSVTTERRDLEHPRYEGESEFIMNDIPEQTLRFYYERYSIANSKIFIMNDTPNSKIFIMNDTP